MDKETVEQKLKSFGYVHPENSTADKRSKYKTFTENSGLGKAKSINDFNSTTLGKIYTKFDNIQISDNCPKCDEVIIKTCQCAFSDKSCKNGHIFYTERDGKIKFGNPHL
jgi:hypothetical protein